MRNSLLKAPRLVVPLALLLASGAGACVPSRGERPGTSGWPQTRAERSAYTETSRYDEVVDFMREVAARSDRIHLLDFGYSYEGRALPLAVVGDLEDGKAATVLASGKTRVYLQGNIHAGEVCGKEALLMLLRDLAQGEHPEWDESLVLLIAPIYNADGNERIRLTNRPRQNGPIGGMGQRPNAQGLDLNRDHMKVESPEARSLLGLFNAYDPQVAVDLHTTNGSRHAYHLTYAPPLNPNTHPAIDSLLRDEWLPALTAAIKEKHGQDFYYYGNLPFRQNVERAWYTFDHRPRFNNSYVGLRNRIAILSEAYAYASFEERVGSSLAFVQEILEYAADNTERIDAVVAEADADSVVGRPLALRSALARSEQPVDILIGDVEMTTNPYSGRPLARRLDVSEAESMYEYGRFEATESVAAPSRYLVPSELSAVLDRLRAHGIQMRQLQASQTLAVERFRITDSSIAEREFQGHRERTLEGHYESAEVEVAAGTWSIDVDQPLGRLAFYLLEPRSDDGLVEWNLLDEALDGMEHYPILRIVGES